jgi:hypothetical protein
MFDKYDKNKLKIKSEETRRIAQNSAQKSNYFLKIGRDVKFIRQVFMWNIRINVKR